MVAGIAGELFLIWRLKDGGGNHWLAGKLFLMCLLTDGGGNHW